MIIVYLRKFRCYYYKQHYIPTCLSSSVTSLSHKWGIPPKIVLVNGRAGDLHHLSAAAKKLASFPNNILMMPIKPTFLSCLLQDGQVYGMALMKKRTRAGNNR